MNQILVRNLHYFNKNLFLEGGITSNIYKLAGDSGLKIISAIFIVILKNESMSELDLDKSNENFENLFNTYKTIA